MSVESPSVPSVAPIAPEAEAPPEREVALPLMLLLALVVGIVAGLGAIVFKYLIAFIYNFAFYGRISIDFDPNAYGAPSPWGAGIILVPVIGGLIVVWLVRSFAPEAKGHGVPEVMYAIYHNGGNVRGVVAVVKSLASAISIGTGASVGREGPIIQIGSSFGSTFARALGLVRHQKITLLSAGAGAGIAATFNTPLGGVLFASEVLLPEISARTFLPVVVATATSTYVFRLAMGIESAFLLPLGAFGQTEAVNGAELVLAALLGVVVGVAAWLFVKLLAASEDVFEESNLNPYIQNIIGMTSVGLMGYVFLLSSGQYHIYSVGYATIQDIIDGGHTSALLLLLLFAGKLVATCVSLGSGASGGIFSPSLFMGATLGGAVGALGMMVAPDAGLSVETFAVIGMGAMVGGATSAAMTAIVMIFEMTRDYEIILPLVLAVAIAIGVRRALIQSDIYTIKLRRRGRPIPTDRTTNMFLVQPVSEVMETSFEILPGSMTVSDALKHIDVETTRVILTDGNRITGFVRFGTIPYRADRFASQTLADIGSTEFIIASTQNNLNTVVTRMNRRNRSYAIVVNDVRGLPRPEDIAGIISREEIAKAVVQNHYG
ncbi:chloride channel protein [Aurantimonas sp. C2-6-R+9]|uniref:chloride channel protein n=1 Tax=unclassified Aurantimonas TaxID=2638230 RepID=UPI002E18BE23|nr:MULTISPECIES: chloride channel protein [unclassified Aurantimonas]MEC5290991.1 chloride channel protein [Aurantimonas sp. C2-3-R2]MEC5381254.1 chloride channel protein [Aurantimonas sp. C2-6-R+9]MEC5412076.1 chloride channel protein [Aurantimonas sp. C2-4-R8]